MGPCSLLPRRVKGPAPQHPADQLADRVVRGLTLDPNTGDRLGGQRPGGFPDDPGQVDAVHNTLRDADQVDVRHRRVEVHPGDHRVWVDLGDHRGDVKPVDNRLQVDLGDDAVDVQPTGDLVQVQPVHDGLDVDPVDNCVDVDARDDAVHIDPSHDLAEVDPADRGIEVNPGHRGVEIDPGDDAVDVQRLGHPVEIHVLEHDSRQVQFRERGVDDSLDDRPQQCLDQQVESAAGVAPVSLCAQLQPTAPRGGAGQPGLDRVDPQPSDRPDRSGRPPRGADPVSYTHL